MPGATRKRKIRGIIGEGFYGTVYELNGAGSFCARLPPVHAIQLFIQKSTDTITLKGQVEIAEFLTVLKRLKQRIAKVIKKNESWGEENVFLAEIKTNREILNIRGMSEYLTNTPIIGFRHHKIIGAIVESDADPMYVIFGEKCDNRHPIQLPKLITDIVDSLLVLDSNEYEHNDIKMDNIVLCKDRYKLIDWGLGSYMLPTIPRLSTLPSLQAGTTITTSPIRVYCRGKRYGDLSPADVMMERAKMTHPILSRSSLFKDQHERIRAEYNTIVANEPNRVKLYSTYRRTFGFFQLGITILIEVITSKLPYEPYRPIIEYLTSLIHPIQISRNTLLRLLPANLS